MSAGQTFSTVDQVVDWATRLLAEETERWTLYVINRVDGEPLHRRRARIAAQLWCNLQKQRDPDHDLMGDPCPACWQAVQITIDEHARAHRAESDFYGR